jgi:hypothetical protein
MPTATRSLGARKPGPASEHRRTRHQWAPLDEVNDAYADLRSGGGPNRLDPLKRTGVQPAKAIPATCGVRHTVELAIGWPSLTSSPFTRRCPTSDCRSRSGSSPVMPANPPPGRPPRDVREPRLQQIGSWGLLTLSSRWIGSPAPWLCSCSSSRMPVQPRLIIRLGGLREIIF